MGELWFYHLGRSEIDAALPPLLEKCLQRGWRALVRGGVEERLDGLDVSLWTYRDESFLPHGRAGRDEPDRQPVWLTGAAGNANGAQALFLIDGADSSDSDTFERAIMLFDGRDEAALAIARTRWKAAKDGGVAVSYWKETDGGRWEKQG
ncbi:MAG TPA: DNA polymerase III subunit chi [Caulobacterales bacterium]|jgi:DNA polymerase-3 subunit chi|nr:DNA polymerase III subunit chi [Caulobacterales bacterium]